MALYTKHKNTKFGVGDTVRVMQRVQEGDKSRLQAFEGVVIGIKGKGDNKTFTVRRIGEQQIGVERIFPLISPVIDSVEVVREGTLGTRRAKLYHLRGKPKREVEKIYSKAKKRVGDQKKDKETKKTSKKKNTQKAKKTNKKKAKKSAKSKSTSKKSKNKSKKKSKKASKKNK